MFHRSSHAWVAAFFAAAGLSLGCSSSDSEAPGTATGAGGSGGAGATGGSGGSGLGGPGIGMMFNVSLVEMMGQQIGVAVAAFQPEIAVVPFDPTEGVDGFTPDTCRTPEAAVAECQTADDCTPGQECQPETDGNGNPIAGTGLCENPKEAPVDIGPLTVGGFTDGDKQMLYNPGQNGAYTVDGTGDGQVPPSSLVTDGDYTFSGDGDASQGLGAFSGSLHVPPAIALLEPVPAPSQFGFEITLDTSVDTTFQWAGTSDGFVLISIASDQGSFECLAHDDGEFTVPAAYLSTVTLNAFTFFNVVSLERRSYGTASGPGLVSPEVSSVMSIMVNAKPPPP